MRLAVLLCGVLSGVIALGFGWWGQAGALLHVAELAEPVKVAVILAIQPIALGSIAGGVAILFFPAISRATLLASAVGWLGLVAILGGGIGLPVGVLILLSAGGGLLGFLPSLKKPMFRVLRAHGDDAEDVRPRGRNSAALRYDLRDAISERAVPPQQMPPAPPSFQQMPPVQRMQPVPVQPQPPQQPQPSRPQPPERPPQPARPPQPRGLTFSSFETMERGALPQQVPPAEPPPAPPAGAPPPVSEQSPPLPTLGNIAPPLPADGNWQVYFPPPEAPVPAPTKPPEIKPAVFVPRYDLAEDHSQPFVPSPDDLHDAPVLPIPPPPPERPTPRARGPRSYDFRDRGVPALRDVKQVPRRRSKAARRRAAIGIAALAIVIIGAPALLVLDAQMRGDGEAMPAEAATSSRVANNGSSDDLAEARLPAGDYAPVLPSVVASEAPSSSNAFATLPPISTLPSGPASTVATGPGPALAPSSSAPVVTAAAALPMPKGPPYASPFDYCTALSNSDAPDESKITGGMPRAIVANAQLQARITAGEFHWRCMDKAVWTCVTVKDSPACEPVPNSVDRVLFCAAHPDVQVTNSPAGDWGCDGFTPVVSPEQLNAVDRRGFDRRVWVQLPAPQPTAAASAAG